MANRSNKTKAKREARQEPRATENSAMAADAAALDRAAGRKKSQSGAEAPHSKALRAERKVIADRLETIDAMLFEVGVKIAAAEEKERRARRSRATKERAHHNHMEF